VIARALAVSASHGKLESVEFLAPNISQRRYLDSAMDRAILANPQVVTVLIAHGARLKGSAIAQAAQYRPDTTLEMLLKTEVDPALEVTYRNHDKHGPDRARGRHRVLLRTGADRSRSCCVTGPT
jgi:hypothetical protein